MLEALYISAIGLQAQKEQLDALAGNLANVGTTAFKRQSVDFSSILDRTPASQRLEPTTIEAARPNRLVRVDLTQGEVHATGRALDIAIQGSGFVQVALPAQRIGYSRAGSLQVNAEGGLSLPSGHPLIADVRIPNDVSDVEILDDGSVVATMPGEDKLTVLGQIELATFTTPEALQYRGEGVYTAPEGLEPTLSRPGEEGTSVLATRSLEGSNVQLTDEIVALLLVQRVYELNSRVFQVADELMGMTNNLRNT